MSPSPRVLHAERREAEGRLDDAALMTAIAAGDLSALGVLYDRHHRVVRRVLSRTAQPCDVDDVLQATFLEIPKIARGFDGRDSARAWLCGIAVRLESRRRRTGARFLQMLERFAVGLLSHGRENGENPERAAARSQELARFEAALARLDARKRDAFVLFELGGLTVEQIAQALEIPQATVRTRLFYARAELRASLQPLAPGGDA